MYKYRGVQLGSSSWCFLQRQTKLDQSASTGLCKVARSCSSWKLDSDEEDNAPDSYKCPISRLIMRRPVQLSDGHSYEKKEIKKWLKRSNKSPCTGDTLENTNMTDNFTLRSIIQDDMQKKRRLNSSLATSSNLSGDNPVA